MTIDLSSMSTAILRRAVDIKERIEKLTHELASLVGGSAAPAVKQGGRRKMSVAARAKIGAAQKARWAKAKGVKAAAKEVPAKKRRKISAEGRARIAAAAKARWAKVKAGGKAS